MAEMPMIKYKLSTSDTPHNRTKVKHCDDGDVPEHRISQHTVLGNLKFFLHAGLTG